MDELKPCPFCGNPAVMHETEFMSEYVKNESEIPKDARIIKTTKYPTGNWYIEFRRKAFVPQCSVTSCLGRTRKLFDRKEDAIEVWNRRIEND